MIGIRQSIFSVTRAINEHLSHQTNVNTPTITVPRRTHCLTTLLIRTFAPAVGQTMCKMKAKPKKGQAHKQTGTDVCGVLVTSTLEPKGASTHPHTVFGDKHKHSQVHSLSFEKPDYGETSRLLNQGW